MSKIICGDCIDWLKDIEPGSVDMCYIDPPFFSNKQHEIIWGNGYELRAFNDRWKGGINAYIEWMEERVKLIHRSLKDTGSIFLHCDWRASHRLRVMLDEVFGAKNFVNEIIWCYTGPGNTPNFFKRKHDTIFYYRKTDHKKFFADRVRSDYKASFTAERGLHGKKYEDTERLMKRHNEGKILEDWWTDISNVSQWRNELIGYKTQKPEELLKRIILCATNEGDMVLDCFGGGGTTAAVASNLRRKFITGDVSPVAVRVIADRLKKLNPSPLFDVLNLPRTMTEWRKMKGHEFAERICRLMGWGCNKRKSGDGGIDGWANNRTVPIQIKNSENVGINPIKNFYASLGKAQEGIFVAWSFAKTAEDYRALCKQDGKVITFKTAGEILNALIISKEKEKEIEELYDKYSKAA